MTKGFVLAVLLLSSACASTQTQMEEVQNRPAEGQRVKIQPTDVFVSKSDPPVFCRQLGGVNLYFGRGDYDSNIAALREEVAEAGGNYLVMDTLAAGRAFDCPKPCVPECSPGFTCVERACVSACNPACKSGESCGGDRLCHPVQPVGAGI